MPNGHRVGTNKIRTDPPIVSVHTNFFCSSVVCEILVRQFVHLTNHFFSATQFDHGLSESCITDEPIVNAQEFSFLAFLLELIRSVMFLIAFFLPVAVAVGSPFLDVVIGNRKEVTSELEVLLVLFCFISSRSARTCSRRCRRPSTTDILCTVLWVPHRVVHTVQCFQLL